jgi:eukaryotic-like serine/threonine-protein kinase
MADALPKTGGAPDPKRSGAGDSDRAPAPPDPLIGSLIAEKFEVIALLGEGAMGRIYRARHVALDRMVAIKVLHKHLGGEDRVAKRFHREAKAASRLSHPNSVQIIDFGRSGDGLLYIAMELLEGEDLQTILDHDYPLAPKRIASLLVPSLRAVEEAHRAGIVHRDFKPDNIIVFSDRGGREHVKVCDFGIAKILDGEGNSITVDGFVCGTPQYMAPEQARGDDIDHRVDVYAAGVVLYQMLVGAVPFGGDTALGIITRHLTDMPVPPHERVPDMGVPLSLELIVMKAMSKDPAARYQSAGEMADAIEEAVIALGPEASERLGHGHFNAERAKKERRREGEATARTLIAPSTPELSRRPMWMGVGGLVVVLALTGIYFAMRTPDIAPVPTPRPVVAPAHADDTPPPVVPVVVPPEPPVVIDPPVVVVAPPDVEPGIPPPVAPVVRDRPPRVEPVVVPPVPPVVADSRSEGQRAFDDGRRLFLANDVSGAIRRFEDAARLMPSNAEVQKQLGRAYMRGGDVDRSVAAYRRYLVLAPDAADRAIVEGIIGQH